MSGLHITVVKPAVLADERNMTITSYAIAIR